MVDSTIDRVSAQAFMTLPESNQVAELIDGEIIVTPPTDLHQHIVGSLYFALRLAFPTGIYRLAPTGIYLDEFNIVEPDIFWVSPENQACHLMDARYWQGAPDLVIEVLSPSTATKDRKTKFALYEKFGVREYWLVDPEAQLIEVYRLVAGAYGRPAHFGKGETLIAALLNDAAISLDAVFA